MPDFLQQYFLSPLWEHEGYNAINTVTYVAIALASAYALFFLLRSLKIKIGSEFILSIIPFILFGSAMRVVSDSIDTNAMQQYVASNQSVFSQIYFFILSTHVYDYGYFTVTPGIYVVTAAVTLACILVFHRLRRMDLLFIPGTLLFLFHFFLLVPLFQFYSFFFLAIALASLGTIACVFAFKRFSVQMPLAWLLVFSHALDGAATFTVINILPKFVEGKQYFEQHVLSRAIGGLFGADYGYLFFFVLKISFASAAVAVLNDEKPDEKKLAEKHAARSDFEKALKKEKAFNDDKKNYLLLLLVIFGLAPGVRDALRLLAGV
ncbi:DUF63 family protein [Candidatus Micrarchaeota archaeon]|nr:DUF63 family protein [Candidatus Micrarchaeota archaeon]